MGGPVSLNVAVVHQRVSGAKEVITSQEAERVVAPRSENHGSVGPPTASKHQLYTPSAWYVRGTHEKTQKAWLVTIIREELVFRRSAAPRFSQNKKNCECMRAVPSAERSKRDKIIKETQIDRIPRSGNVPPI